MDPSSTTNLLSRSFRKSHNPTEKLKPLTQLNSPALESIPRSYLVESPATESFPHHSSRRTSLNSFSSRQSSISNPHHTNAMIHNLHGLPTTQSSLPKLSLGHHHNRFGSQDDNHYQQQRANSHPHPSPHPYDLILPGEEHAKIQMKSRTASAAAAAPSSVRSSAVTSSNQNRSSFRVANSTSSHRRFTQTAHSAVHSGSRIGNNENHNAPDSRSFHGRRYSTIAREPSAATVPMDPTNASEILEDELNYREPRKLAKSDAQMLIVSFKSLLGRDGGGHAVEQLLAFVLSGGFDAVMKEVKGLVQTALQGLSTLQAAYVSVHLHEIIEQVQKIAGLLFSEAEVMSWYDDIWKQFQGLAAPRSNSFMNLNLAGIWAVIYNQFTTSPVYRSALLRLIETFSKLILASEQLRDSLWASLSQAFSQPQHSSHDGTASSIANFLGLLFSAVEQLTGSSISPLVKHFISWLAIVDDLLTDLAQETCQLLSQPPLSTSASPVNDYTTHPLGYIYSPTESCAKLDLVMEKWFHVFREDPVHKTAFEHFWKSWDNVLSGISGNSTFARFSRDLARVWKRIVGHPSEGIVGTGLEGGLECLKTLASEFFEIRIEDVLIQHQDVDLSLGLIKLFVLDTLPLEIGYSTHSRLFPADCSFKSTHRLEMKALKFGLKNPCSLSLKDSKSGLTYDGTAMIDVTLDLSIDFVPKDNKLPQMLTSLPYYGGSVIKVTKANVKPLSSDQDLKVDSASWNQVTSQLGARIETSIQEFVDSFFKLWLMVKPATATNPTAVVLKTAQVSTRRSSQPANRLSYKLPTETHGNARDRFKDTIRNLTGIKTGLVLSQLPNPLSATGSPLASPSIEEDPESKRKRRQSMADYLTEISTADSTLPENIQRPPVADYQRRHINSLDLPSVFDEEEVEPGAGFKTMAKSLSFSARGDTTSLDKIVRPMVSSKADIGSVLSHRGGMPNFPMPEMSYEAYERAEARIDDQTNAPIMEIGGHEVASMGKCLSELATRDTTTEEAIAHPPTVNGGSHMEQSYLEQGANLTMDKITRHLSGLSDLPQQDTVTPQQKILRRNNTPPEAASKVVMAKLLTEAAMEDLTLPENQAKYLLGPGKDTTSPSQKEMVVMRDQLSKIAATDTTLSSNIATPPGTQHVYRAPVGNGYTGLKVVRSMSSTLNTEIERDYTTPEGQAELYSKKPQADGVIGFSDQELKQRRQSFKLTPEAMKDTTLIESIRNPPIVTN